MTFYLDTSALVKLYAEEEGGDLAERHALRGYDAVHLASAVRLSARFEDLRLLAFDDRLNDAARDADLTMCGDEPRAGRETDV